MSEMIELNIKGMTCMHCVGAVKKALTEVEGVTGVEVTLEPGSATVQGSASTETLIAAVKTGGYEAEPA